MGEMQFAGLGVSIHAPRVGRDVRPAMNLLL